MKIEKIYSKYKIMPHLQEHMYKVAGVSSIITDNFNTPLDKKSIIQACLLHDMGNIIKSNLKLFPKQLGTLGLKYWQNVKQEFIDKYGYDEKEATLSICKDIHVQKKIIDIIGSLGFRNIHTTESGSSLETKICEYSDLRVSPKGVVSMSQRIDEVVRRYNKTRNKEKVDQKELTKSIKSAENIEKQIFSNCKIRPHDITEEKVKPLIEKLQSFDIETT